MERIARPEKRETKEERLERREALLLYGEALASALKLRSDFLIGVVHKLKSTLPSLAKKKTNLGARN